MNAHLGASGLLAWRKNFLRHRREAVSLFVPIMFAAHESLPSHRVISLPRGKSVAFGLKRTLGRIL